jgi:hypothetical protein
LTGDYAVHVGRFDMYGPHVATDLLECTLGVWCNVSISGHELNASNELLLVEGKDRCGMSVVHNGSAANWTGITNPQTNANDTYRFGRPTIGVPGTYLICWAHDPANLGAF